MEHPEEARIVTRRELSSLLGEESSPVILDVANEDRHGEIRIPGAARAGVLEVTFLDQVRAITNDPDSEIVVSTGSSGNTADGAMAADKLIRAGYRSVGVLEGGLSDWRTARLPVEGTAVDAPESDPMAPLVPDGEYAVDTGASRIEWTGRNPNSSHHGTLPIGSGRVCVSDGVLSGSFKIDVARIRNTNLEGNDLQAVLIAHLLSDDFLFAKLYPEALFELAQGTLVADRTLTSPNYDVRGKLAMRGVTADLDFAATVSRAEDGALMAEAHFDIDRTKWNIVYGSSRFFDHLGMHLVFDLISLGVRLVARPE